jgi:adenylate cyclase
MLRISYRFNGKEELKEIEEQAFIGRRKAGVRVDLDLSPDVTVSRTHARIWREAERYWIEDLNSAGGTLVNGTDIKGKGRRQLHPADVIEIGKTVLSFPISQAREESSIEATQPDESRGGEEAGENSCENIIIPFDGFTHSLDARVPSFILTGAQTTDAEKHLALIYTLPLEFGKETELESLLQLIIERVVEALAVAGRGTLFIKDRDTGELVLKAHTPKGKAAVSFTMARQAIEQLKAVMWPPAATGESEAAEAVPESFAKYRIGSAMCVPLLWMGNALGVLWVDTFEAGSPFLEKDLRLLQAVAHHAAMAVAHLQLQESLRQQGHLERNMLRLVSPQLAELLKRQRGPIKLGGTFRDVTILLSDIRGFTNLSARMSPDDVTEMLEDYYGRLVGLIFDHQGTVDKFVGDAILAVFGSPEDDKEQQYHAIQAALGMQSAMREVNARRAARNKPTGELGIGIHCGEVIHGFIGAPERMEYTVIGDTVNRASRFCDGAKGGELLISDDVYRQVWNRVEVEPADFMTKHEGTMNAFRVVSVR